MPRHEPQAQTNSRREMLHYLILISTTARDAADEIARADEYAMAAKEPALILNGQPNGVNPQVARMQIAKQYADAANAHMGELGVFFARLNAAMKPPEVGKEAKEEGPKLALVE